MKLLLPCLFLAGCGSRSLGDLPDAGSRSDTGQQNRDAGKTPGSDAGAIITFDSRPVTADVGPCHCKPGEVWLRSACVPTDRLGCGPSCQKGSCPPTHKCDPCAAAPSCISSACAAACIQVSSMSFEPGVLRVSPTVGGAGQKVKLRIEGGTFYIGALWWSVRLGPAVKADVDPTSTSCTLEATLTPPSPGSYPVEVAYGGKGWALAGFYTASGGVISPPLIQPGYPCQPGGQACAEGGGYSCACVSGRCACK
jgi:hypothetical protein